MISGVHPCTLQLLGGVVQNARQLHDPRAGGHALLIHGDDQEAVPEDTVELDRARQIVALQRTYRKVNATAGQPVVIVHPANVRCRMPLPVEGLTGVVPWLRADVAAVGSRFERRRQVTFDLLANGEELQTDRNRSCRNCRHSFPLIFSLMVVYCACQTFSGVYGSIAELLEPVRISSTVSSRPALLD